MAKETLPMTRQELIFTLISLLEIENQLVGNLEVVGSPAQLRKAKQDARKTSNKLRSLIEGN